jgi:hypothetical protein
MFQPILFLVDEIGQAWADAPNKICDVNEEAVEKGQERDPTRDNLLRESWVW